MSPIRMTYEKYYYPYHPKKQEEKQLIDGLIISSDETIFNEFNNNFSSENNHFLYAESVSIAIDMIDLEIPDYIFIIEKTIDLTIDIIDTIFSYKEYRKIPIICFISQNNWGKRELLWQYGLLDIILLPKLKEELAAQLNKFHQEIYQLDTIQKDTGMRGNLRDYSLIDLVQILAANKKTGVLSLENFNKRGKIWFFEGEIYDCEYFSFGKIEGLFSLMLWNSGDFAIKFVSEEYEKKIDIDHQKLLLDTMERIDKRNTLLQKMPDRTEVLLISPETDVQALKGDDLLFIKFFQGGKPIAEFLQFFTQDELELVARLSSYLKKKILLTQKEFDSFTTAMETEMEEEDTTIKGLVKRLFRKKEIKIKEERGVKNEDTPETDDTEIVIEPKVHLFKQDNELIRRCKAKVEEL
jgi:hypothetical protein